MRRTAVRVNRKSGGPFSARPRGDKAKTLNITSLIDILTILLIFMIKNIAMDSTQRNAPEGMLLPTTITKNKLLESGQAVSVKLYNDKVLFGGDNVLVGSMDDFLNKQEIRQTLLSMLKLESKEISLSDQIPCLLIQADKELSCRYITEFINFSATANFANIYFSTIHTDDKAEVLGL